MQEKTLLKTLIKENKLVGIAIISFVYVIAGIASVLLYRLLDFNFYLSLLICDVLGTIIVFIFSIIFNNASMYDPYWSVAPMFIVLMYYFSNKITIASSLFLISVCLWGVRLTFNWAYTFKNLSVQDWRYDDLKNKSGKLYFFVNFLGIHMFPTLVVYMALLPGIYLIKDEIDFSIFSVIGFVISVCAMLLQFISDSQMHRYRKNRTGNFIRCGLWKYSRHPNYLGEILMWIGVAIQAMQAIIGKWYLGIGAIVVLMMFLVISIPMADKRQSMKEGFEEYKEETRALLPIPKFKKAKENN